jgi:cell division protein FtsB
VLSLLPAFLGEKLMKKTYKTSLSPLQQKKLLRISLLLALLFLLALFFMPGKGLYFQRQQKLRVAAINAEKEELVKKNEALRQEIQRLKTDERYLEEVARDQRGLLKKDEQVFDFSRKEQKKTQKQQ